MNGNAVPRDPQASASDQDSPQIRGAKKHRRPALSCIQCRRRKVKCDRNVPCNRCTYSKNTVCAYDPEGPARARASLSAMKSTPKSFHNTENNSGPSTEQVSHNTLPLHTAISSVPEVRSPEVSWTRPPVPHQSQTIEPSVEQLKERIRQLEKIVTVSVDNVERPEEISLGETIGKGPILRGTPDQSRFFGMGHWLTIKKEVRDSQLFTKAVANRIVWRDSFIEGW